MKSKSHELSGRLKVALKAGGAAALFAEFSDWEVSELKLLLADVGDMHARIEKSLDDEWGKLAMLPQNFLSTKRSEMLDQGRHYAKRELLAMCSEICSVALYYIGANKKAGR